MTLMTITTPTALLKDDFRKGLDLTRTRAIVRLPPSLIADDGTVSTSDQGLYVRAAGTNPLTSEPAFTKTSAAENDHVKWMANNAIYRYYERLKLSNTATYAAFSSAFPPVRRTPDQNVKVSVAYDRAAGIVRWLVDDAEVARVSRIGFPSPAAI